MAKVILHPLGEPLEKALDPAEARRNAENLAELESALDAKRAEVRAGWGKSTSIVFTPKGSSPPGNVWNASRTKGLRFSGRNAGQLRRDLRSGRTHLTRCRCRHGLCDESMAG